jgi:prolyl oligopeptidase
MPPLRVPRPWPAAALAAALVLAALAGCAWRRAPAAAPAAAAEAPYPVAPGLRGYPFAASRTTTQDFFGTPVADDFTWLEDPADPATRAWQAAEQAYARRFLDAMPARSALRRRLQALADSAGNVYTDVVERGGVVFALKSAPPLQRPVLVILRSVDDPAGERVVFDPNERSPDGALAIDFFRPSPDGRRVAVALADGTPDGDTVRVIDLGAGGQALADTLARVTSAAGDGDVAWSADGGGLFFTQSSEAGAPPVRLMFHRLGAPAAQDRVELAAGLPRRARVRLEGARDGRHLLAVVENGRGGDVSLYLKAAAPNGEGAWRRLAAEQDGVRDAQFGDDDAIWVRSIAGAPRGKVLRVPLAQAGAVSWARLPAVATPLEGTVQRFAVAGGALYLAEGQGGPTRLRRVDLRTRRGSVVVLPAAGAVAALARVGRNDVVAQVVGALEPPLWMHVGGARARRTALVSVSDAQFNDSELVHEVATSRDGTPVPVDILRRKGTRLDGRNPVLLAVASSADLAITLDFDATRRMWLDRGGVVAVAALRDPRAAGEQAAVDDLLACADALVRRGYTQPALLGVRARGDGALAAAAAMTQRPDQFRALVAASGRYDLLRPERGAAGQDDAPEFGGPHDRAQFDALAAVSPLQAVRDGVRYPSVLLLAGERERRVDAAQSRKMAARLQQADPSGRPILYRTDVFSGQPPQARLADGVEQLADELGFLLNEIVAAQ